MYQHIMGDSAPPYSCLKGRAMGFVPLVETMAV